MKKPIIFLFSVAIMFMTSCTKEADLSPDPQLPGGGQSPGTSLACDDQIDPAQLPANIMDHISANHAGQDVMFAKYDDDEGYFEVYLSGAVELYFSRNGQLLYKDRGIDPVTLPQPILDYLLREHPGADIVWAELDDDEYEILLSNCLELYFDESGRFLYSERD